ncbi:ATP-binding protein [Kitasatospora sp. NPDC093806]|uniref:ATP-binding protein n=1 Tax=Kitasatospora sp. NPDC093806 TaxID=3155075 RepID=UPI003446DAFD
MNTASFPVPQEWGVDADVQAVPAARRLVSEIVRTWRVALSEDALQELELCTSELIANAVEHTGDRCRVAVRWTGGRVRIEVADSSPLLPDADSPGELATRGRGLLLVESLSHDWGWEARGAGKIVWCEFKAGPTDELVHGWGTFTGRVA